MNASTPSRLASTAADISAALTTSIRLTRSGAWSCVGPLTSVTAAPASPATTKIKKSGAPLTITLQPTVDILATVAARQDAPYCVGFAAETNDVARNADDKRRRKKLPLIVANVAQDAFGSDDNEVTLFDDDGAHPLPRMGKLALARQLIAEIARRLPAPAKARAK